MKKIIYALAITSVCFSCKCRCGDTTVNKNDEVVKENTTPFPFYPNEDNLKGRVFSAATARAYNNYESNRILDNQLYSNFFYTPIKFDYNGGDGTISRRDVSKVILVDGLYYVYYTYRNTKTPLMGPNKYSDVTPSVDWDLSEIWYATSPNGFTWTEQGVAVPRPPKPELGCRSISTADVLVWEGKYYIYYQAYNKPSGYGHDRSCVTMSYSDSPRGPFKPCNKVIIDLGESDAWDNRCIHDPYPLVHNGQIYIYYKSGFDHWDANNHDWCCAGVTIGDSPEGPFKKHHLNPLFNSGHETALFPYKEGVAAFVTRDGLEHNTMQYAEDWVNFEIKSFVGLPPTAAGAYVPDAFTDTKYGLGITWGLCHFTDQGGAGKNHSILARFDCDLSLDLDDPAMKRHSTIISDEEYFKKKITPAQKARIMKTAIQTAWGSKTYNDTRNIK